VEKPIESEKPTSETPSSKTKKSKIGILLRRKKETPKRTCKNPKCKETLKDDWPLEVCPDCAIKLAERKKKEDAPPPRVCKNPKCKTELSELWEHDVCYDCMTKIVEKEKPTPPDPTRYQLAPVDIGLKPSSNALKNGAVCFVIIILIVAGISYFMSGGFSPNNTYVPPVEDPTEYDWNGMNIEGWFSIEAWVTVTADGRLVTTAMSLYHEYSWDAFAIVEEHGYEMMGVTHQFNDCPLSANMAVRFSTEWGAWSDYSNVITVEYEGDQNNIEWEWQGYTVHIAINRG
jgi:hypothetical protein